MLAHRKITLTLPVEILEQMGRIAARRKTTVSILLTRALEEIAARDVYAQARARHLAWLEHSADLGTYGQITHSRESLHLDDEEDHDA
jgi:hypothetical protein